MFDPFNISLIGCKILCLCTFPYKMHVCIFTGLGRQNLTGIQTASAAVMTRKCNKFNHLNLKSDMIKNKTNSKAVGGSIENAIVRQRDERGCRQTEATTLIESEVRQKALMQLPERFLFNYIHVIFE